MSGPHEFGVEAVMTTHAAWRCGRCGFRCAVEEGGDPPGPDRPPAGGPPQFATDDCDEALAWSVQSC